MEIETIQDFKVLYEIGALTPDMTVKLSRIWLGEDPSKKTKQLKTGKKATVGGSTKSESPSQEVEGGSVKKQPPNVDLFV